MLDQPVRLGLLLVAHARHVAVRVELERRLEGADLERVAPLAQRARRPRARALERLAPGLLRAGAAGEQLVHLAVGEPLVAAHAASGGTPRSRTSAPFISISTVTASLSSPGRSEQASFESTSGSIGSTAPGTYTLVPRRNASRSSRPPGRTYAVTSAMWTQTRTRSPSRRAEIASSKSLRVVGVDREGGQVAQVHARVGRVRLVQPRPRPPRSPRAGSCGAGRGRASAPRPRRGRDRAARAGAARARRACPQPTSTRSPAPAPPRSTAVRGPGPKSGSATRKRPRFSSTATIGSSSRRAGAAPDRGAHRACERARRARPGSASSRSVSRVVHGPDLRLDALACEIVSPSGR